MKVSLNEQKLKARGIELRRRDTPVLIKKLQREMLARFAEAKNPEEFKRQIGGAIDVLREYIRKLLNREVEAEELVFTIAVSKDLEDYQQNSCSLSAVRQYRREGMRLLPGQVVRYVITNQSRKAKTKIAIAEAIEAGEYDSNAYLNHLPRAAGSLLLPFGLGGEGLRRIVSIQEQA